MEDNKTNYYVMLDSIMQAMLDLYKSTNEDKEKTYLKLHELAKELKISEDLLVQAGAIIVKDGYATNNNKGTYLLTELGKLFLKSGGYTKLNAELTKVEGEVKRNHLLNEMIKYGSLLGGIWFLMDILRLAYCFFQWLSQFHILICH